MNKKHSKAKKPVAVTTPAPAYVFSEHENVAHYDWRLQAITTFSVPTRFPNGYVAEPGHPIVVVCPVEYDSKTELRFDMPSASALLLDYSHTMWGKSRDLLALFTKGVGTPDNPKTVEQYGQLIELLEQRMAAVVFAYTALEAFSNELITYAYTQKSYVYPEMSKDGTPYTIAKIERFMTLDQKLCGVLPDFCRVKSVKKQPLWQSYGKLKMLRHLLIHPKVIDQNKLVPQSSITFELLTDGKFRDYALDAKAMMMYYAGNGSYPARWLFKCPF